MYLSVDIGGTKTLVALFSRRGRVIRRRKFKTAQGRKTFLSDLESVLGNFSKYRVRSVVVAAPGAVQKNCSVVFGNRNWGEVDVLAPIQKLFDCPVYLENDANLACLFESHGLNGKTVFLTFSTGIGGGIAKDDHILLESKGFEPGHKMYFYDGKIREWEDIAAASAIEAAYHVDRATDLRGKSAMTDIANRVYLGIPDIVKKYHPDNIVLGGPLGKIFKLYVRFLPEVKEVKFCRPKRPNESVIYGGYLYAKQKERE